jgi:hypothetical protein
MKIAKQLKSIGARLFGNNQQPAANEPVAKPSIVHIGDRGQPVRVPLTSYQPVVAERRKIPTGTIKAEADKLKFIGLDENNHPVYLNDQQMHAHIKFLGNFEGKQHIAFPVEARSEKWSVFSEIGTDAEVEALIIHGVTNTAGMEQIYGDDLAKAMSSNIQAKVVIRAGGDGK